MLCPNGEVFRIGRELFLQAFHDVLVFKKQNGSCSRLEHGQFLRSRLEPVGRNDGSQGVFGEMRLSAPWGYLNHTQFANRSRNKESGARGNTARLDTYWRTVWPE